MAALRSELLRLDAVPREEPATTLLALKFPAVADFDAFMACVATAQEVASEETRAPFGARPHGADAVRFRSSVTANIQVVPFHPSASYSALPDDAADYATRSTVPILHLLRQSDVDAEEARWQGPDITAANAARLRGEGRARLCSLLARCRSWDDEEDDAGL